MFGLLAGLGGLASGIGGIFAGNETKKAAKRKPAKAKSATRRR